MRNNDSKEPALRFDSYKFLFYRARLATFATQSALSVISLLRSDLVAFRCEADMRTVDRSNQSDVLDPKQSLVRLKFRSAAVSCRAECAILSLGSTGGTASETARLHHAARWRSSVAARGARATG